MMGCSWFTLVSMTALVVSSMDGRPPTQSEAPAVGRTHILTPDRNGQTVQVHLDDVVLLKLPTQLPSWWAETGPLPGLRLIGEPRFDEMGEIDPDAPALGRPKWFVASYRVISESKAARAEWIYCKLGRTSKDGKPIPPAEPLVPGQIPTRQGTFFRVTLDSATSAP